MQAYNRIFLDIINVTLLYVCSVLHFNIEITFIKDCFECFMSTLVFKEYSVKSEKCIFF